MAIMSRVEDGQTVYHGLPKDVVFCSRCVMSNQRPSTSPEFAKSNTKVHTVSFADHGVCHACLYSDYKKTIDFAKREEALLRLLDQHRSKDGSFDVVVPGSGGKDSAFVSHVLKYKYGMHPLTVTWAPHVYTDIGWKNFQAWIYKGGLDNLLHTPNPKVHGKLTQLAFMNLLNPFQPFIMGQKTLAPRIASQYGIKLIMYGENQAEYHNDMAENETPLMARSHYTARPGQQFFFGGVPMEKLSEHGISRHDVEPYLPIPEQTAIEKQIEIHYFSYYHYWVPQDNYYYAVENCGFEPNPERSEGTYSKYASLDDRVDGFHYYTMFVKFGQGRAMNDAAHEIRDGHISREEAVALIHKFDGEFPKKYFREFLEYTDISEDQFHAKIDENRSPHLWEKQGGDWVLKHRVQ
jgi:N-acetyl sugar amidotransferase